MPRSFAERTRRQPNETDYNMHFYPHNIPDFNNATRHLTRVERSVYRDAIERYYDTEEPLPAGDFNKLARILLCSTQEEKDALKLVLDDFFTLTDAGHEHDRCNAEIAKYRSNSTAKARAGRASAEARKSRRATPVEQPSKSVEQTNNYELGTNNQELIKDNVPSGRDPVPVQDLVSLFNSSFETLPEVKILNEKRRAAVRKRWIENKNMQSLERWGEFFEFVKQSDFLMGRTEKPWSGLCFDWIFNPSNFAKIIEGNYHEKNK